MDKGNFVFQIERYGDVPIEKAEVVEKALAHVALTKLRVSVGMRN